MVGVLYYLLMFREFSLELDKQSFQAHFQGDSVGLYLLSNERHFLLLEVEKGLLFLVSPSPAYQPQPPFCRSDL